MSGREGGRTINARHERGPFPIREAEITIHALFPIAETHHERNRIE